jgi:hypothetical protein
VTEFYQRATQALVIGLLDVKSDIPQLMQALVAEHMLKSRLAKGTFSAEDQLHTGTGDLRRALIPGKPHNIYKANIDLLNSEFEYGINSETLKYAAIHEYGGTIPITAKMRRFFWYKYALTHDEMWRNMALTKKASITVKKRPYLEPAFDEFNRTELPQLLEQIYTRMTIVFNAD